MTDRLLTTARRLVLLAALATLAATAAPARAATTPTWGLIMNGNEFAGRVVRVDGCTSAIPALGVPASGGPAGTQACTFEVGPEALHGLMGMIDPALHGVQATADVRLLRADGAKIGEIVLPAATLVSLTTPALGAASHDEATVQVTVSAQAMSVTERPGMSDQSLIPAQRFDPNTLRVTVGGRQVQAASVGAWTMRFRPPAPSPVPGFPARPARTVLGDVTISVPETDGPDISGVFAPWGRQPDEIQPVTVSLANLSLSFDAGFMAARSSPLDRTVGMELFTERAALQVTPG